MPARHGGSLLAQGFRGAGAVRFIFRSKPTWIGAMLAKQYAMVVRSK
jgi:hypothetical protein